MAIVFISPKARERFFLRMVLLSVVLVLATVSLVLFITFVLDGNQNSAVNQVGSQPNIAINMNIVNSDQVKNLNPFYDLQTEFSYVVADKNGKQTQGNISAATKEDAQALLQQSGYTIISLDEATVGRSDPFVSY